MPQVYLLRGALYIWTIKNMVSRIRMICPASPCIISIWNIVNLYICFCFHQIWTSYHIVVHHVFIKKPLRCEATKLFFNLVNMFQHFIIICLSCTHKITYNSMCSLWLMFPHKEGREWTCNKHKVITSKWSQK